MHALATLPDDYRAYRTIDLSQDLTLLILLNLAGLGMFFIFGFFFWQAATALRPDFQVGAWSRGSHGGTLPAILGIIVGVVLVLVIHELVHGLFFWIFTRARPHFGFRGAYAFAAAPGWYIQRNAYLLVGLSPLVVISAIGLLLLLLAPPIVLGPLLFALTFNAAGAVGDLAIVGWLLTQPVSVRVQDLGDALTVYRPERLQ